MQKSSDNHRGFSQGEASDSTILEDTARYKPLRMHLREMSCLPFRASNEQREIVLYAIHSYGYLLPKSAGPREFSFLCLANRISEVYDTANARNAAVVDVLRKVHEMNRYGPQSPAELCALSRRQVA